MIPSLVALVMRVQPLTPDEVARFSPLTVSRLAHARGLCAQNSESAAWTYRLVEQAKRASDVVIWRGEGPCVSDLGGRDWVLA